MNYKKILKNRHLRHKILEIFSFIPDKLMLKIQYRIKTGRSLNLKKPERFTEKIQWYKLNYRNSLMHQCVDKYLVRNYIISKGLENILVPLIGKYDSIDDINWDEIPTKCVVKTTHGSGGLNVIICSDKNKMSMNKVRDRLSYVPRPVKKNTLGREWAYYGLQPGIIIEELLVNRENPEAGINDYKVFCYNGHAKYIVVDIDRYIGHKRNFYDRNWNNLHVTSDCPASDYEIKKPENLDEMLHIAEKLSSDFPYVRVDLYDIDGKIYFGELTFYPWSGYVQFEPDSFDYELGKIFEITDISKNRVQY